MHNDKVVALFLKVLETLKNAPKENHTKKVKSRVYNVPVYGQRTHK
tara:strand:+ start:155 stop:292 length:138 start_codon:yes stop_codon:yes gene_type:complete